MSSQRSYLNAVLRDPDSTSNKLGGHDHLVWLEFKDMTEEEQLRARRYMYDNDVEQFAASPLYAYYGVDMLGFATSLVSLVDSSEKG